MSHFCKRILLLHVFLFIFCFAFTQKTTTIEGVLPVFFNDSVFFESVADGKILAQGVVSPEGNYTVSVILTNESVFRLKFGLNRVLFVILSPGETLNLTFDKNDLSFPIVKGSKNTEFLYQTFREIEQFEVNKKLHEEKMDKDKEQYISNFLENNPGSLVSLFFLDDNQMSTNKPLMSKIDSIMSEKYPENSIVASYLSKIRSYNTLSPGALAPEIELPNTKNEKIKLSSLRGKVVLIDFWASWCGPCRKESPFMVSLYNKYKKMGFEIYGVSLDINRDNWLNAIESDKLTWIQVSELKQWQSEVVNSYRITGIPHTVLLDKNGRIVAKGLRSEALESEIARLLKN